MTKRLYCTMAIAIGLLAAVAPYKSTQASGPVLGAKVGGGDYSNGHYYDGYGLGVYGGYRSDHFNYSGYGDGPYGYGSGSAYEFPSNGGYGYGHGSYYDNSGVLHFRRPFYGTGSRRDGYGVYGSFNNVR